MSKKIVQLVFFFQTLLLFSCGDCLQNVSGTILDKDTQQPIDSVQVQKSGKEYDKAITDNHGNFKVQSISGGLFHCPAMTIVISKNGYETMTEKIDNAKYKIIYLKKIKK